MADQDFNIKVVTTADRTGIQQTLADLEKLRAEAAKQKPPPVPQVYKDIQAQIDAQARAAYEVGRAIRVVAGGALIAGGYQFVSQLRQAATEIEKISSELDKEGEQLVSNAQKFSEMAKFATMNADVIKIGEGALKGVESAHKRLLDASGQELTIWQKIADVWAAGFRDEGPIAQAKRLAFEQAAQNYELERQNAIREISEALRTKEALAAKSYAQQIEFLNQKIAEQEAIQKRAGVANIEDYLKAGAAAENFRKILQGVISDEQKAAEVREKAAEKEAAESSSFFKGAVQSASPQVQRTLLQEEAARRAGIGTRDADLFQLSAEAFKRGFTPAQQQEYEGLTTGKNQQGVIDAIQQLRQDLIGIWR